MIHEGTHPDVVEAYIQELEKNALIKNSEARTLYGMNEKRNENPIIAEGLESLDNLVENGFSHTFLIPYQRKAMIDLFQTEVRDWMAENDNDLLFLNDFEMLEGCSVGRRDP